MRGRILVFHMEDDQYRALRKVCRRLQIDTERVPRQDYGQQLGALAGIIGFKRTNQVYMGSELAWPMIVFSGIGSEQLDFFLAAYKEAGIPPVDHKAVITSTNIRWTPVELARELEAEHRAMH